MLRTSQEIFQIYTSAGNSVLGPWGETQAGVSGVKIQRAHEKQQCDSQASAISHQMQ